MNLDNPEVPEFAAWSSYWRFAERVRRERRYVSDNQIAAFLATVIATNKDRDREIRKGAGLFRAQLGVDWVAREDDDGTPLGKDVYGFGADRMKPLPDRAPEGRANPVGISMLYLATTVQTAISEVRSWIGAEVSVAQFEILRDLKTIDLSVGHGESSISGLLGHVINNEPMSAEQKAKAVWIDIDNAFSQSVTLSDDRADYVPTQILAELFRSNGYDALATRATLASTGTT